MSVTDEFYEEIAISLACGLVDVELELEDYQVCFRKAKRIFKQQGHNSYRNVFLKMSTTDAVDGVYNLPPLLHTVVQVIPAGNSIMSGDDIFNQLIYDNMFGVGAMGGTSTCNSMNSMLMYEMQQQQADGLRRRATAGGISFHHDEHNNTLRLLSPYQSDVVVLDAYYDLSDEEYMQIDWIIRWTIAEAKQILGTAYRKFSGISAPTGETQLAGAEYISESKEEKRELLAEIENYVDGSMDYGQITIG